MSRSSNRRDRCRSTGKRRFRDHREALKALQGALTARHFASNNGVPTRRREVRAYQCLACKAWHLTSWTSADNPASESRVPVPRAGAPYEDAGQDRESQTKNQAV